MRLCKSAIWNSDRIRISEGGKNSGGAWQRSGVTKANKNEIHGDDQLFDPQPWVDAAPVQIDMLDKRKQRSIILFGADHYMQKLPTGGTMLAWDKHLGKGSDNNNCDCEWAWVRRTRVKREVFRYLWKGVFANKTPLDLPPPGVKNDGTRFARIPISPKPVELMRWCIDKVRPLSGLPILDPYMGSGSTAIAALSLGHKFRNPDPVRGNFSLFRIAVALFFRKIHIPSLVNSRKSFQNSATSIPTGSGFLKFIGCEIDTGHFDVACRRIEALYTMQGGLFDAYEEQRLVA